MKKKKWNGQVLTEMACYLLFGGTILYLLFSNRYLAYVAPRMKPYLYFTAGVMLIWIIVSLTGLFRIQRRKRTAHCLILIIPALLLLMPHDGMNASSLSGSVSLLAGNSISGAGGGHSVSNGGSGDASARLISDAGGGSDGSMEGSGDLISDADGGSDNSADQSVSTYLTDHSSKPSLVSERSADRANSSEQTGQSGGSKKSAASDDSSLSGNGKTSNGIGADSGSGSHESGALSNSGGQSGAAGSDSQTAETAGKSGKGNNSKPSAKTGEGDAAGQGGSGASNSPANTGSSGASGKSAGGSSSGKSAGSAAPNPSVSSGSGNSSANTGSSGVSGKSGGSSSGKSGSSGASNSSASSSGAGAAAGIKLPVPSSNLPEIYMTTDPYTQSKELHGYDAKNKTVTISSDEYYSWINEFYTNYDQLKGFQITLTGSVYKNDPTLEKNQFVPVRLAMTCCVADLTPLGIVCTYDKVSQLKSDQWVTVTGTLYQAEYKGQKEPRLMVTSIKEAKPISGYIYPY